MSRKLSIMIAVERDQHEKNEEIISVNVNEKKVMTMQIISDNVFIYFLPIQIFALKAGCSH
ncbi:hypothetical protein DERP_013435 [Dermatophagoides pteronyssinus]|uniref:Uncharacterized protein n=1 Tax=Dermatophagoides pteronyssinus TaxID=6956 RepID=A0ABQ8JRJ9_DERPT|nr:hypothetical protein DERP_013435 [Dermatophagoides pteronyssinus]